MAADTESKRASILNVGSFFPGRIPYLTEPDGSDLNSPTERGAVPHHYAGISASTVVVRPVADRPGKRHITTRYFTRSRGI